MQLSDIPAWFAKRFAADATGTYVRAVPATTADPAAASMTLGFPPATFTPIGAGGVPMDGRDLNGILNYLSAWSQWSGVGGPAPWSSVISAAAGGYPLGAVVLSGTVTGRQYQSTVNNNVTNPDTGGAGWRILVTQPATAGETTAGTSDERVITPLRLAAALAGLAASPGQVSWFARPTAPTGWLKANGAEISRTAYAPLFDAIGTYWGVGNGSTTFNIPDLRGEFIRAWDDGRGVDPGRPFTSVQADDLKAHVHSLSPYHMANAEVVVSSGAELSTVGSGSIPNTASTGGTETRPRNVALLACIRY